MTQNLARVAVFISGSGTDLQSLIDASRDGRLSAEIAWVVSSKEEAYGLVRAGNAGIESAVFKMKEFESAQIAGEFLVRNLRDRKIDYVVMAGYLKMMPVEVLRAYPDRVVNIHPALLPKYGGKGMYGRKVHEAVIASGDKQSGPTVHLADEVYDHGKILEQRSVPVLPEDTPDTLAARVLEVEHELYPIALNKLIRGEYRL
ncbi:phosphoribosylglycinamide formyltransferase [candidate division GN15 bacterium]|uniref:Phosphoribosylglycinamide formyltransferase n=1 Tax=candidate division GN15 bacterium TaxID=2072418 RepID=A0A855X1S3_9BACT|nr:MAG: phosphoribosylglycinamide formyltransferase [candidate division GN15 bacterium]